jgi:hypothetical protein
VPKLVSVDGLHEGATAEVLTDRDPYINRCRPAFSRRVASVADRGGEFEVPGDHQIPFAPEAA